MTPQRQNRVFAHHPATVVRDRDQRRSSALDFCAYRARAGVERIFDQLLQRRGRPFHHLARRDLAGHVLRQDMYQPFRHR